MATSEEIKASEAKAVPYVDLGRLEFRPKERIMIRVRPDKHFKARFLALPSEVARSFLIDDVLVRNVSQLRPEAKGSPGTRFGSIPSCFKEDVDPIDPEDVVVLIVWNRLDVPAIFTGRLFQQIPDHIEEADPDAGSEEPEEDEDSDDDLIDEDPESEEPMEEDAKSEDVPSVVSMLRKARFLALPLARFLDGQRGEGASMARFLVGEEVSEQKGVMSASRRFADMVLASAANEMTISDGLVLPKKKAMLFLRPNTNFAVRSLVLIGPLERFRVIGLRVDEISQLASDSPIFAGLFDGRAETILDPCPAGGIVSMEIENISNFPSPISAMVEGLDLVG